MVSFIIYRFFLFIFSITPLNVLYRLSNGLSWIFKHIIPYRRPIITANIMRCFPQFDHKTTIKTVHDFYDNFSDILVEGIKGLTMDDTEINRRYRITNREVLDKYLNEGKSVIMAPCHYTNWEWGITSVAYDFPNKCIGIYKSIKNHRIEDDVKQRRASSSMQLINTRETRLIQDEIPKGKIIILMSDQAPSNMQDAIWVNFFGQDTACLHGIEKYAIPYGLPVMYCEMSRQQRGYYQYTMIEIWDAKTKIEHGEITQKYMSYLEASIRQNPANWLWSHKRWKRERLNP